MSIDEQYRSIALACDHAGYELKEHIKAMLIKNGYRVTDFGTNSIERVDYPDQIHPLAQAIDQGRIERGIIVCGSGNGVAMTANKYQNVRAGISWNAELAALTRQHNDANVLSLPARFISDEVAEEAVLAFLTTAFEGGRHQERVKKIAIGG